jgi:hypothetical protein
MEVMRGEHAWLEQGIVSSVAQIDKAKRRPTGGGAVAEKSSATAGVGATQ